MLTLNLIKEETDRVIRGLEKKHFKGAKEAIDKVLLVDNNGAVTVGTPTVEGAKVVCEVKSPLVKGDKVIVFRMHRRKDYRKRNGHREQFTEVVIKQVVA